MDYIKIDVDGIVNTYHANMLKLYVERQDVMSHCLMSAEASSTVDEEVENEELILMNVHFRRLSSQIRTMTLVFVRR